ncbi:heme oxygenase-like protein [Streptomyces sp. 2132.2]|uniref:iron-containing redox enzyme family protein n=1 Tax=Streptomyces vinaceus TaxID=1960 RepID=UPI000F477A06|nr:heme oxygenase-like protein [Streptomyces sp. 2132.2]
MGEQAVWRRLYAEAVEPEALFEVSQVRTLMEQVAGPEREQRDTGTSDRMLSEVERQREDVRHADQLRLAAHESPEALDLVIRGLLVEALPMASVLGVCLQGLSAPGVFEDDLQLQALTLLADDIGVGRPRASRYDEYRLLLERELLHEHSLPAEELASVADIDDALFALPAVLLAMSRRSDAFFFELVGADLAWRSLGLLPAFAALRPYRESAIDWSRLDPGTASGQTGLDDPKALSARLAGLCADEVPGAGERVAQGAAWMASALDRWSSALLDRCAAALEPERALAELIRRRAREAAVYHHDFTLGDRTLAQWFREAQTEPLPLVRALADSKLVRPGDHARSPLVRGLIGPRGRMFRIFTPEDVNVINRWIDSLPAAPDDDTADAPVTGYPAPAPRPASAPSPGAAEVAMELREAYYQLQGRALSPWSRAYAVDYVQAWLRASRENVDRDGRALPAAWPREGLRAWLLDQHDQHDLAFTESDPGALPSREDIVDSTVQLAPLTLIDGAWLQGFTDVHLASSRVGFPLFEIYWDELGNGEMPLNHPKIYRDGLRQMGVELPPTGSREFAYDERVREESLRLPVYWLSIGKLPRTFLPEILGLNLAMELSGVGGSYRSARRFLKHYGFSTHFVDLHNTIDNVSTGHSAWAAEAIDTHLRRITTAEPERLRAEWERVRVGYASLATVPPEDDGPMAALRSSLRRLLPTGAASRTGQAVPAPRPSMHHPAVKVIG